MVAKFILNSSVWGERWTEKKGCLYDKGLASMTGKSCIGGVKKMEKLTLEDLNRIKEKAAQSITFSDKTYLLICGGTGCHATGSIAVREALQEELAKKGLDKDVKVVETGCNGFCAMGPILVVHPGDIFLSKTFGKRYS